jgi:hypothetical protein
MELVEGMLSAKVANTMDGWLWHSDKIDSMSEVVLDWFGRLVVVKRAKDKMVRVPLHGVVDLSGCKLLGSFCGVLIHFLFEL